MGSKAERRDNTGSIEVASDVSNVDEEFGFVHMISQSSAVADLDPHDSPGLFHGVDADIFGGDHDFSGRSFASGDLYDPGAMECSASSGCGGVEPSEPMSANEQAVGQAVFDRALFEVHMTVSADNQLNLPWESGIMGDIFGDKDVSIPGPADSMKQLLIPESLDAFQEAVQHSDSAYGAVKRSLEQSIHATVMKNLRDTDAVQDESHAWEVAVSKWHFIYKMCNFSGIVGRRVRLALSKHDDVEAALGIIRDVLGIKSPNTAIKRADTLKRLFAWLITSGCAHWPVTSEHVLSYLTARDDHKVSPSTGTALMEALRFAHFVMGLEIHQSLLSDPQIAGRVHRLAATKDGVKQARPLLCSEVATLERFVASDSNPGDVYLSGCCLFAIYARTRWSDLKYVHRFWVDRISVDGEPYGYLECTTKFHKTSTTLERKSRHMPLTCPILGVTGVDWTVHWMKAAQDLGFIFDAVPTGAILQSNWLQRAVGCEVLFNNRNPNLFESVLQDGLLECFEVSLIERDYACLGGQVRHPRRCENPSWPS